MAKPKNHTCTKCTANPAEYKLTNGSEVTRECSPCIKDTLLELVIGNYDVRIHNNGKDKDGLIQLELA
jgi:hypothetical protein